MKKIAVVLGGTGLVGSHLVDILLQDPEYMTVKVFVRHSLGLDHEKLEEHLVDFEKMDQWQDRILGDELFSAMGTTIKQAGSREAQFRVDFTYQYEVARAAARNGVHSCFLVSSAGADCDSFFFYPRIKGELEREIGKLSFKRVVAFRPSLLVGERREKRLLEDFGVTVMGHLAKLPFLQKYRPVRGEDVARAMVLVAKEKGDGREIVVSEKISALVGACQRCELGD